MKSLIRILITIFAIIFIYSCSNDTSVNNIPPPPSGLYTLNGTIENWTLGSQIIKLRLNAWRQEFSDTVVATSTINSNGSFSFNNLPAISNNILGLVTFPNDSNCSGNVTVNPNGLYAGMTYIRVYNTADSNLGTLTKANSPNPMINGYVQTYYSYFSEAGSISGNYYCNMFGFLFDEAYSTNFPAKWYYLVVKTETLGANHLKFTINNTEPSGMKWYFQSSFENDETPSLEKRKRKIMNQLTIK